MRQTTRITIAGIVLATLSGIASRPVRAQDAPVVFQHGFISNGSTWASTASRLRTELKLKYVTPSSSWCQTFETQSGQLPRQINPTFGTNSGIGFVGHSNGGLISREFRRETGRSDKIITVGSLHQGAPLAAHFLNGDLVNFGRFFANTIASVFQFYNYYDNGAGIPEEINDIDGPAFYWLGNNFGAVMWNIGFAVSQATGQFCPVLYEMEPGSSYLTGLNSASNLSREQSALSARVSVTAVKSPINLIFYTLFRGAAPAWIFARWRLWAGSIAAYLYYNGASDPFLANRADVWLTIAAYMVDIDAFWAFFNGSLVPNEQRRTSWYGGGDWGCGRFCFRSTERCPPVALRNAGRR